MRTFYVAFSTPNGPGATFFKTPKHPLERSAYGNLTTTLARSMSMRSGVLIQPDQVIFLNIVELEHEAAVSYDVIDVKEGAAEETKQAEPDVSDYGIQEK
jgi:hypothetical protein